MTPRSRPASARTPLIVLALIALSSPAAALTIDFTGPATTNPDSVTVVSGSVTATAYGYQAEFTGTPTVTVWGPFPTTTGTGGNQIFGTQTRGTDNPGLGLLAQPVGSLSPTENDRGTALFQPGFDNSTRSGSYEEIQFAVITFSQPVDVSEIIVGTPVGSGHVFVAGGTGAVPDLTVDLLGTLTTLGVQISLDNATGATFTHSLATPLLGIDYLIVGTPPKDTAYGPLVDSGSAQWFLESLTVSVPEPSIVVTLLAAAAFGRSRCGRIRTHRPE